MMHRIAPVGNGFTLIEALVALVILGIAATGILRAAEAHIDNLRALERRAAAQWVAENALTEASLGIQGAQQQSMLGVAWSVKTNRSRTQDPDLLQVTVQVSTASNPSPMLTMRGFADSGNTTP